MLFRFCALASLEIALYWLEFSEIFWSSNLIVLATKILSLSSEISVKVLSGREYKILIELISNFLLSFTESNLIFLTPAIASLSNDVWLNCFLFIWFRISLLNSYFSFWNKRFIIWVLNLSFSRLGNFVFILSIW